MNESEIIRLGIKVKEFKKNYEMAKTCRENLVLELNSLDEQIDNITKSLGGLEKLQDRNEGIKKMIKKDTKKSFIRMGISVLIAFLLRMGIDSFIKNYIYTITQYILQVFLPILSLGISINIIPNLILRIIYCINTVKINKKQKILQKEKEELISERISLGTKYKDIRESEVMTKDIYIETEKMLSFELANLYNEKDEYKSIDTRDIYHKIRVDELYYQESIENKKRIIDDLLKNYLREKLIESNFNNINLFIDDFSSEDLFLILLGRVPKSNHQEVLSHIIHALLGISSNMQNYGIVWYEEKDEMLIADPEIVFDETGKWEQLKTHKNTSYEIIFKTVYNTFVNVFMRENQYKRKREKNNKK